MTPNQIKRLRKALNVTQQGLADRLGVPQSTVGRWEAGTTSPRGLYLKALRDLADKAKRNPAKG